MQWFDGDAVPKIADAACQSEVHYLNFKRKMEMAKKGNSYQIHILFITFLLCTKGSPFWSKIFLDHDGITYDQACNASFHSKIELIQYNDAIAITGAIRGT